MSDGIDGGGDADPSIVERLLSSPLPPAEEAALLSAICVPDSAQSRELVEAGVAARLCGAVVDAAAGRLGTSTSTSSSEGPLVLSHLRVLRNLCASGAKAGEEIAPTGVARAAAVLAALPATATAEEEERDGGGGGASTSDRVSTAAAQLLANLAACSAAGALAVWTEAISSGGGGRGDDGGAPSTSSPPCLLAAAARQGGPRVAGPVASAADASFLRRAEETGDGASPAPASSSAATAGEETSASAEAAAGSLCSSPLLAAVVDGLQLESGLLHDEDDERGGEERERRRERDAAAAAVAARATARLLRSLSFVAPRGLELALGALSRGPPARRGRRETALRLLGHVVAEEGVVARPPPSSSPAFDSFASALLGALDDTGASPGEVEACLALLRELGARGDEESGGGGSDGGPSPPPPSRSSPSPSVVAALVRAGLVPRLLDRLACLPPVRGQAEAEAESEARREERGGGGGGEKRRRERRLPRYPEERADVVSALANALHRRRYVADALMRCEGGAELLLAQCGAVGAEEAEEGSGVVRRKGVDGGKESAASSPSVGAFAREWSLWALRNLTEASEDARRELAELRPVKAVPSEELERAGLRLELDEGSGKFELRKI